MNKEITNMNKVELLAPVGGHEQFLAAVENGADAVYLGGTMFNARSFANNFSEEELGELIRYAHIRDVKVYITLNTLVDDDEIKEATEFARRVYLMGADAFIVQDLGLAKTLRESIPNINLHFSTQGTVYSIEGIESIEILNFERIVLARELSIDEIKDICARITREIEVFVHGAMCICYSGQCRLSSMIGGRSGNRGKCAQPCRLPYTMCKGEQEIISNYCMSPKDLCGIYDLPELINSGITSLKIEGRMKSPEYVACVTKIYRKYIDLVYSGKEYKVNINDVKELQQVFNRGNFTTGYFHEKLGKDFISRERAKHWGTYLGKVLEYNKNKKLIKLLLDDDLTMGDGIEVVNEELPGNIVTYIQENGAQVKCAGVGATVLIGDIRGNIQKGQKIYKISSKNLNGALKESFSGKLFKKVPIKAELIVKKNENLRLILSDSRRNRVEEISEYVAVEAINKSFTEENAKQCLEKLGDTPFRIEEYNLNMDKDCLIPISVINELRRNTTHKLEELRGVIKVKDTFNYIPELKYKTVKRDAKISAYLYNTDNLDGLEYADRVYIPAEKADSIDIEKLEGKEVVPYLLAVTKGDNQILSNKYESVLAGNLEHIEIFKGKVKNIYGDYSLNIFNSYSCELFKEIGLHGVNFSFELNLEQMKNIKTDLETEVTVYGQVPLMISEHCPIGAEVGGKIKCGLCQKGEYFLKDRTGVKFPIITDIRSCRSIILNSKKLFVPEIIGELEGKINYFRAYFYDEPTEERGRILKALKGGKKTDCTGYTAGHFYRGV